jgi:hypothetical protein
MAAGAVHCADVIRQALAGLIIPLVAVRRQVQRLVFLHALLPHPGQSVVDQLKAEPDMFNAEMFTVTAPFWEDEAVAIRFLLHDCSPEVVRNSFSRLRPEPGVLFREVTPLESWPDVPSSYIVCADDRTATPGWARRAARERLGVEPIEIPGGHCPMLARPRQLADVLEQCA